jgi:hypothetical protein
MAYLVGAYWQQRMESRQSCTLRVRQFLHELAGLDSSLSNWYKRQTSRKAASVPLPTDLEGLRPLLKPNRRDVGGDVIAELGFNFSSWTGQDGDTAASLAVTCGAYSPVVRNSVVVAFDPAAMPTSHLLEGVMKAAVSVFDPEDAVVSSTERLSAHAALPAWKVPAMFRYGRGTGFSAD